MKLATNTHHEDKVEGTPLKNVDLLSKKWDLATQTPHGGQDWRDIPDLVEDFSVTTNGLGPVPEAMEAAKAALLGIEHYPSSDNEPALSDLAAFVSPGGAEAMRDRLLLGNGASELIDMIARLAPEGPWKPGPFLTQYQEYRRSAGNYHRAELDWGDVDGDAALTCIVNPCNPTGDYLDVEKVKSYISCMCSDGSWVVVDESMQPWHGPEWRADSLTSQGGWIEGIRRERGIKVFVIHSWTKIWACPGIRLGSVVCPTKEDALAMRKVQVPWSVNSMALAYLSECCKAEAYMQLTWQITTEWRAFIMEGLKPMEMKGLYGRPWSSWIWIDTGSSDLARELVDECKGAGVPIRWGKYGYDLPTFVRLGVRQPKNAEVLLATMMKVVDGRRACASDFAQRLSG